MLDAPIPKVAALMPVAQCAMANASAVASRLTILADFRAELAELGAEVDHAKTSLRNKCTLAKDLKP